jgi:hypothetical protein
MAHGEFVQAIWSPSAIALWRYNLTRVVPLQSRWNRFFLSPRVKMLTVIRDKIGLKPKPGSLPPLNHHEPPRPGEGSESQYVVTRIVPTHLMTV